MVSVNRQDVSMESPVLSRSFSARKLESKGICSEHDNFNELRCMDCETWICRSCVVVNHRFCKTLIFTEACKEMAKLAPFKVEKALSSRESVIRITDEFLMIFEGEKKELIKIIEKSESDVKDREKRIRDLELLKSEERKMCEKLNDFRTLSENIPDFDEFLNAAEEVEELLDRQDKSEALLSICKALVPQTIDSLKKLCESQPVYVMEGLETPMYGKVEVKNDNIWISCFQSEKPEAKLISFYGLLCRFLRHDGLPKKALLKLTPEDRPNEEIDVVIETNRKSPRGKNFILLCSGLKGHNYKGRTIKHRTSVDIDGDSYYHLSSGPPIVEGIRNYGPMTPWKEGFVYGMSESDSWFQISLKDYIRYSSYKIGVIVSGLQKLKKFKGHLTIKETGLVI